MAVAKKHTRMIFALLVVAVALWLAGFAWFYHQVPRQENESVSATQTDIIVVLTGGMGRVEKGIDLLKEDRAKMLLISGVDKDVKPEELVKEYHIDTNHPVLSDGISRMVLDYGPRDTVGNAIETRKWMKKNNYHSVRLVTSSYHMPRSLMEFRHAMPEANIIASPVFPEWKEVENVVLVSRGSLRLIFLEYNKYILRKLYYALPEALQVISPRTSKLHPPTDVGLGSEADATSPSHKKETRQ
ncbi:MAG: YdcF family protein [Alphaproteobacteria bacterium]|nr:YdcF family protein [Alphaproteobacteria bacterium]